MANNELLDTTISELAPLIRDRKVSPVEVTEAALARAEELQPKLNSFITILHDRAMDEAREQERAIESGNYLGPLHGIPIGIKDNIATAGVRTTLGSKVLADHVPDEDAHVVTLCRQAGAILLGKENLEEFAAGATSNNPHYGAVHNPWKLDRIPGGSSGGGGANVAAGVTFASLGTDLGGSVRIPGSLCGVVGLKQTFGRVSQRGLMVTSFNGDHIGPMTRSTRDASLVLQAIAGYDALDPSTVPVPVDSYSDGLDRGLSGLKMGIPTDHFFDLLAPEVAGAVERAIAALEELGATPVKVALPTMKYSAALRIPGMADGIVTHEPYLGTNREDYGPDTLYRTLAGQFVLGRDYSKAMKVQRLIKEEFARVLQQVDFLAAPTCPVAAPPIGAKFVSMGGKEFATRGPGAGYLARNTSPSNSTGLPAVSVPCGHDGEDLPIGLQIIGRPFDEATILRVAHTYEGVSPAQGRRPSLN